MRIFVIAVVALVALDLAIGALLFSRVTAFDLIRAAVIGALLLVIVAVRRWVWKPRPSIDPEELGEDVSQIEEEKLAKFGLRLPDEPKR